MKLVTEKITTLELHEFSQRMFGGLVEVVVDIERKVMVIDADMHSDEESFLLKNGSQQTDLWGINLYPELTGEDFIEFDSMINIRPQLKNFTRDIKNPVLRAKKNRNVSQCRLQSFGINRPNYR